MKRAAGWSLVIIGVAIAALQTAATEPNQAAFMVGALTAIAGMVMIEEATR